MRALSHIVQKLWARLKFFGVTRLKFLKSRSKVIVKVTRSKYWYGWKDLVMSNTYVKYEGRIINGSEVIDNINIFEK